MYLTLAFYIVIPLLLSLLIDFILKYREDWFEQLVMRLGIGIAAFTLLGALIDLLQIPLHFITYIIIGAIVFAAGLLLKKIPRFKELKKKTAIIYILVFVMFLVTAYMYISGSYSYIYMEDGDPWGYAAVSKNIAEKETFGAEYKYHHYSEPYPQGYQIFMGVLHQTNDSMYDTMKFFHNLTLALSILFMFFFVKQLFKNRQKSRDIAFYSTFFIFVIPSWVSHFLFSLNFNMVLIPVLLYSLLKSEEDKNWFIVASVMYASILINHFFTAFIVTILLIVYFVIKTVLSGKLDKSTYKTLLVGFLLSLIFYIPTNLRHPEYLYSFVSESHGGLEIILNFLFTKALIGIPFYILAIILLLIVSIAVLKYDFWFSKVKKLFDSSKKKILVLGGSLILFALLNIVLPKHLIFIKGTASRIYTFGDFFNATSSNMINNPVGWGFVIFILTIIALAFLLLKMKKIDVEKNQGYISTFYLFFFFLILTLSMNEAFVLMPFRQWTFMALFVSIIAGLAVFDIQKHIIKNKNVKIIFLVFIIALTIATTFIPKFTLNTMTWPDHLIREPRSYPVYSYIRSEMPPNTNIVNPCRSSNYLVSFGALPPIENKLFNKEFSETSRTELIYSGFENKTTEDTLTSLKSQNVSYIVLGATCLVNSQNPEITANKINELVATGKFEIISRTESELLLKVVE